MKRIINYKKTRDNKYEVIYISNPVSNEIAEKMSSRDNCAIINVNEFVYPPKVEGKIIKLYYNKDVNIIETEYVDIDFDQLPTNYKLELIKKENEDLKAELKLTQDALFELDAYISNNEIIPQDDEKSEDDNIPEEQSDEMPDEEEIPSEDSDEETKYYNLTELVENAKDGDTIVLEKDVELEEPLVINKVLNLDLNGFTLSSKKDVIVIRSSRAFVNIIGDGQIIAGSGDNYRPVYISAGTINIKSPSIIAGTNKDGLGNNCVYACGSGVVNIIGGTFTTELNGDTYPILETNGEHGTINVTGGQFKNYNPIEHEEIHIDVNKYKVTKINEDTYLVELKED